MLSEAVSDMASEIASDRGEETYAVFKGAGDAVGRGAGFTLRKAGRLATGFSCHMD